MNGTLRTSENCLEAVHQTALVAFIYWFFWMKKTRGPVVKTNAYGYQEAIILVKGGYTPDVILVREGTPVRLNFLREETAVCSEMVPLPDFNKSGKLIVED